MNHEQILEAAKEAGLYMTSPERIAAVEMLVAIIEKRTIERCDEKIGEYAVYMKKIEGGTVVRMPTINVLIKLQAAIRKLGDE